MLSGPVAVSTAADRATGCRRVWTEAGLDPEALQTYHDEYTLAGGYRMAQEALKQLPAPTAIFAANNFIAIGAYRAVADAGLRVPEDVAMVAVDDMPIQLVSDPFFTVIAQPAYEMGRRVTQILLTRLSGDAAGGVQGSCVAFRINRATVKRPAAKLTPCSPRLQTILRRPP